MRVVHQPIKNAISECRIADLFVPPRDPELRGQDPESARTSSCITRPYSTLLIPAHP
jgi:hypothetical protein